MKDVVLFDLGNTLVEYYQMPDFPAILRQAMGEVEEVVGAKADWERVKVEDFEAADSCVRPLEQRLRNIFVVSEADWSEALALKMCRAFLTPIFTLARLYDDVPPTLKRLHAGGYRTAIVSNTPWGSPSPLWQEELRRLGLTDAVDLTVFCRDCGWRKPARQVFDYTLEKLGATPGQCVFVGDDPSGDIAGSNAVGMDAVLIDRRTQTLPDVLKGFVTL